MPAVGAGFKKNGINEIISTLQLYCHQTANLTLTTHYFTGFNADIVNTVASTFNSYCSNATQSISMQLPTKHERLPFVFANATTVSLFNPTSYNGKEINTFFPSMESLEILIGTPYALKQNFPFLKNLVLGEEYPGLFDLKSFGKQNPRLHSLKLAFEWDFEKLQDLNKMFYTLEQLDIEIHEPRTKPNKVKETFTKWYKNVKSWFKKPATTIRFKKVSNFALNVDRYNQELLVTNGVTAIEFDQLDSFKLVSPATHFNQSFFEMIVKNEELSSVDFTSTQMTNEQMLKFTEVLPNLKRATFQCDNLERVDEVLQLLKDTQLEQVSVVVNKTNIAFDRDVIGVWQFSDEKEGAIDRNRRGTTILTFFRMDVNPIEIVTPNNEPEKRPPTLQEQLLSGEYNGPAERQPTLQEELLSGEYNGPAELQH